MVKEVPFFFGKTDVGGEGYFGLFLFLVVVFGIESLV